jgi:broad specificity phosphatase PhoE
MGSSVPGVLYPRLLGVLDAGMRDRQDRDRDRTLRDQDRERDGTAWEEDEERYGCINTKDIGPTQSGGGRGGVSEQEAAERLRRVVARLMDAHSDALAAAKQGVGRDETYEDSEMRSGHLEEALQDVLDILDGASEDVNAILGESGEEWEAQRE